MVTALLNLLTGKLWNSLPDSLYPPTYNLNSRLLPHVNDVDYLEYKDSLISLLGANQAAIALPGEPLGLTSLIEHHIDLLPHTRPVYIPAYRLQTVSVPLPIS